MIDTLKPCPFCAGKAHMQTDGESGYWIECTNAACGSSTNMRIALGDDVRPMLIEQWNRRAANTATAPSQPAPLANVGIRDNTATMSREMWEAGRVLWSVTAEELKQNENLRDRPPFGTYPDVHRPAPTVPRLKDNEIAQLVNDLRTIAQQYHRHGCLRDLISRAIVPPLKEGRREDMQPYFMPAHVAQRQAEQDRAPILLKAAYDLLQKQDRSHYVLNLLTETAHWDEADCDGHCLMGEIKDLLGLDE